MLYVLLIIIAVILFLKRDTFFVRKLWGYFLIGNQIFLYALLKGFYSLKKKVFKNTTNRVTTSEAQKEIDVDNKLKDLGNRLEEVEMVAKIEVLSMRDGNSGLKEKLSDAVKIKDKTERKAKLYSLMESI